ncbi:MAG: hypothetical protein WCS52_06130 [bacterium]
MTSGNRWHCYGMGLWITLCLCAGAQPEAPPAALPDFNRYGVILERKPFGVEALAQSLEPPKISPDMSFTAKFKMAAVTRDDNGVIRVGLVDLKSKQSVMLGVGDSIEGVEVVEADYVKERARLRRPPEDYWVSMSGGSNSYDMVGKEPSPEVQPDAATPAAAPAVATRAKAGRSSYAARREARLRKELQQIQAIEALHAKESKTADATSVASVRAGRPKTDASGKAAPISDTGQALLRLLKNADNSELSPDEVNSLLQEYQKELIRTGQTPLPIPLTPETDQELVNEGILPAGE